VLASSLLAAAALSFMERRPVFDPDSEAHRMWAAQFLETGRVLISRDSAVDDCSVYYPNTVPKPLQLAFSIGGEIAGGAHAALRVLWGAAAAGAAALAALRSSGSRSTALLAGACMSAHPSFVSLALAGSPSIPFIALVLASGPWWAAAASLYRPEGVFYLALPAIRRHRLLVLALIPPVAAIWLGLNEWTAGDPLWSIREVRYAVQAMHYPTPGPLSFWPHALLRAVLVCGPGLVLLFARRGAWPLVPAAAAHLAFLWLSLFGGSLVLDRYLDQVLLLAVPWIVVELRRLGRPAATVAGMAGMMLLWPSAAAGLVRGSELAEALSGIEPPPGGGRLAANELVIPAVANAWGVTDPSDRFVALDRMAWEDRDPRELGVERILVVPAGMYLPECTAAWLLAVDGVPVDTLGSR
jgi:hypothetical protein